MANELILPPYLYPAFVEPQRVDAVQLFQPQFGYATSQRVDLGMTRRRGKLVFEKMRDSERAALFAFLEQMGRSRAFYVPVHGEAQRGSGVFTELLTNNTFANGTTGWSTQNATLTVADRMMRLTVAKASAAAPAFSQTPTVTQYAPHILRSLLGPRNRAGLSAGTYTDGVSSYSADASGLVTQLRVPNSTSLGATYPVVYDSNGNITITGDWIECPWCSLSRCALVDNGPNLLLQSDDFTTTWANTRSTDAANSTAAPDGTTTADSIIEDATATATHYIEQGVTVAAAAANYACSVALKAGTRTFARVAMVESTGSHECYVDVNLSTGALGTATASGANWTNPRAFVVSQGNGWYRVTIVGRKASAATTVTAQVYLASALGTTSYTGDGASLIYAWRASLAQSSVPVRGVQTTTAAAAGTLQTGSALHTKGWLASTNGLLLAGDFINIVTPNGLHLARLTAALNTDAAGLGYLQFAPALKESPADNAAVIPNSPLLKCVAVADPTIRTYGPGFQSDVELMVEEVFG